MIILLHSSKTMRSAHDPVVGGRATTPMFPDEAKRLHNKLSHYSVDQIGQIMKISPKLARATHELHDGWSSDPSVQRQAIDSFLGDIYSGLQVQTWTDHDREFANKQLRILSGLYGILRPSDGIYPYRLEMGYRIQGNGYNSLYEFWSNKIASTIDTDQFIMNLAAAEYSKLVTKYVGPERVVTPKFLTIHPRSGEPTFVVVHAKIARGAYARWLVQNRITTVDDALAFDGLGYSYSPELSTDTQPVYVCKEFGGLGLSVRLT